MVEQDYIMRLIKEIIRAILRLLGIDAESPAKDILENEADRRTLEGLLDRIDSGDINGAENQLYSLASDRTSRDLQMSLLFYSYLNDKSDAFLEAHDFSREEIRLGLKIVATRHGLGGLTEAFFEAEC